MSRYSFTSEPIIIQYYLLQPNITRKPCIPANPQDISHHHGTTEHCPLRQYCRLRLYAAIQPRSFPDTSPLSLTPSKLCHGKRRCPTTPLGTRPGNQNPVHNQTCLGQIPRKNTLSIPENSWKRRSTRACNHWIRGSNFFSWPHSQNLVRPITTGIWTMDCLIPPIDAGLMGGHRHKMEIDPSPCLDYLSK